MEEENVDIKTVFTIKHSEIPPGVTQCVEHSWKRINDKEFECANCPTIIITNGEL